MAALTVFLAAPGLADGVLAALTDLSAAGLVEPFHWVSRPAESAPPPSLLRVDSGRQSDVTIQQIVAGERADVVRVCALVPLTGDDTPLTLQQERFTADLLASTFASARTVRLRCGLVVPGMPPSTATAAVDGWHNVTIAPEDSRGPDMGRLQLPPGASRAVIGRHTAPVVAALLGLWSGLDHHPLDDAPVPPGQVIRLARSFYRRVDTGDAEATLRNRLLAQDGRLPLPSDQSSPVVYVHDVGLATSTMAERLWHKHAAILKGPRREYDAARAAEKIGAWQALKMFFGFLWAAIKNAPAAWYQRMVDSVSTGIASTVNKAVFGSDSAYEVVVNGRTARGERAEWSDIPAATAQLTGSLGAPDDAGGHRARSDLSGVWQDYGRAAMTLADAGARGGDLPPVQVGSNRGVLADAATVVPGRAQRFTDIPGAIAASVRTDGVDATDPLGIINLRHKLGELERTPENGLQARATINAMDAWQRQNANSFGVAVGRRLATAFADVFGEVQRLFNALSTAPEPPPEPGRNNRLARWIQVTLLVWVLLSAVLGYVVYRDLLKWWWAVLIAVFALLLGIGLCCRAFLRSQQELFQLMNKRRALMNRREVDLENLRTALRDLNRLSQAYGEYLCWSRALGAFLAAPLGPDVQQARATLRVSWGLPLTTAVGYAGPPTNEIDNAVEYLRRELFGPNWLSPAWEHLITSADPTVAGGREVIAENSPLWREPGYGSRSLLDRWSSDLFTGARVSTGADAAWQRAQLALRGPMAQLAETLAGRVEVPGAQTVSRDQFLAELDRPAGSSTGGFDRALLSDTAVINDAGAVVTDARLTRPIGIGVVAVVTQLTEGLSLDYLKLGAGSTDPEQTWTGTVPTQSFDTGSPTTATTPPADEFRPPPLGGGFHV